MHFGLRSRQEHYDMTVSSSKRMTVASSSSLLPKDLQRQDKTRWSSKETSMLFSSNTQRTPGRTEENKTILPVCYNYRQPSLSAVWYKKTPMGKNTINNIVKTIKENSPLTDLQPEKKLTNHSARKTVGKKLKKKIGIPKREIQEIKNITGHTTEQDFNDYDSGKENKQRIMSNIIDNGRSASPSRQVLHLLASAVQTQSHSALFQSLHCHSQHRRKRLFAISARASVQDSDSD